MKFGITKGAHHEREYIATQGPVKDDKKQKDTTGDYIRMVYEKQAKVIVMLANLVESMQVA